MTNTVAASLWTFGFEIANFMALVGVLTWLFFKPIRQALEDQRTKARRLGDDAAQKLAEAEAIRQDIKAQRQALASELETMRTQAREAAASESATMLAAARASADRERATRKRDALHVDRAQTTRIARTVALVTRDTVTRFLRQIDGPELEQALINTVCREVRAWPPESLAPVTVESATALDAGARDLINAALGTAATGTVFRVVPTLEGGLRISTAHGLIDASVTGLASFAERSLSSDLDAMTREELE